MEKNEIIYQERECFQLNRINPSGGGWMHKNPMNISLSFQLNRINPSGGGYRQGGTYSKR